jgi:hypothetical protein
VPVSATTPTAIAFAPPIIEAQMPGFHHVKPRHHRSPFADPRRFQCFVESR